MASGAHHYKPGARRPRTGGRGAFLPQDGQCARCVYGEDAAPCTCPVEDRCSNRTARGRQCMKGASHRPGTKCVTAAGEFFE